MSNYLTLGRHGGDFRCNRDLFKRLLDGIGHRGRDLRKSKIAVEYAHADDDVHATCSV